MGDAPANAAQNGIGGALGESEEVPHGDAFSDEKQADLGAQTEEMAKPRKHRIGPVRGQRGCIQVPEPAAKQGRMFLFLYNKQLEGGGIDRITGRRGHTKEPCALAAFAEFESLE
jgi:hypothetical protein